MQYYEYVIESYTNHIRMRTIPLLEQDGQLNA